MVELIEALLLINYLISFLLFIAVAYMAYRTTVAISLLKAFREQESLLKQMMEKATEKKEEPHVMTAAGPMPLSAFKETTQENDKVEKNNSIFG